MKLCLIHKNTKISKNILKIPNKIYQSYPKCFKCFNIQFIKISQETNWQHEKLLIFIWWATHTIKIKFTNGSYFSYILAIIHIPFLPGNFKRWVNTNSKHITSICFKETKFNSLRFLLFLSFKERGLWQRCTIIRHV